jgi:phosphatidylglycerophosphate synthase
MVSMSRLLFAAGFVVTDGVAVRAGIVGAAGLSDILDGWLARRLHAATRWGALIDPIADRVFVVAVAVSLIRGGALTVPAALVLVARDVATALGFVVALTVPRLRAAELKARGLGKLVTALQYATLLAALVAPGLIGPSLVLVAVAAAWSIVDYAGALWRARA